MKNGSNVIINKNNNKKRSKNNKYPKQTLFGRLNN